MTKRRSTKRRISRRSNERISIKRSRRVRNTRRKNTRRKNTRRINTTRRVRNTRRKNTRGRNTRGKNTRRRNTRGKNTRGKMRRKIMKGGADVGALQDQEILHSRVNLGFADFSPETLDIRVKNMRHKLDEYNLKDYGFKYLDMKSQLDQLMELVKEEVRDTEDINTERLKRISNEMKMKILENIFGRCEKIDDKTFSIPHHESGEGIPVKLFFLGYHFRGGEATVRYGKFSTVHCDYKITDDESYLDGLKSQTSITDIPLDELTTLEGEKNCLLNVWINLTEGELLHDNLAFIDKRNVPAKQTSRYSNDANTTMFTRLIDDYDLGEAYTCGKLLQGEGYLFQSTWTPHFSLDKTVSTKDPEWSILHEYASPVLSGVPSARKIQSAFRGYSTRKKKMRGGSYSAVETWDQKRKSCEFRILLTMENADVFERFMGRHHFEGDTIYEYHDLVKLQELGKVKISDWLEIHKNYLPDPKDVEESKNNDELIKCLEELIKQNENIMAKIYSLFDEHDSKELIDSGGEINMISVKLVVKNLQKIKGIFEGNLSFLEEEDSESESESESDEDEY